MKFRELIVFLAFAFSLSLAAQEKDISTLSEQEVRQKLIGTWTFAFGYDDSYDLMSLQKIDSSEFDKASFRGTINADGSYESWYRVSDILGKRHIRSDKTNWAYDHDGKELRTQDSLEYKGWKHSIQKISDSEMVLYNQNVVLARDLLLLSDFQKIERFIRYYGDRKTFSNQWNNNPHFNFPFAEVYLLPFGKNPIWSKPFPIPYHYSGFYAVLPDGTTFTIDYLSPDFILVGDQDRVALQSFIDQLYAFCKSFDVSYPFKKYEMANERHFELSPLGNGVPYLEFTVESLSQFPKRINDSINTISVSVDQQTTDLNIILSKDIYINSSLILTKITPSYKHTLYYDEQTKEKKGKYDYLYEFEILDSKTNESYVVLFDFFNGSGIIEQISEEGIIKVRTNWQRESSDLPIYYEYKLKINR